MRIRSLAYTVRETFLSLKKNIWMAAISATTVAFSLVVLGAFFLVTANTEHLAAITETQIEITAYLDGKADHRSIHEAVKRLPNVKQTRFISKAEALRLLEEQMGEGKGVLAGLEDDNPLPDAIAVKADSAYLDDIALAIGKVAGVTEVKYGRDIVEKLLKVTFTIRVVGWLLMLSLTVAALFIIVNTIKLTVFARRKEIGIMKHIGATDLFIKRPYILEGLIMGLMGSALAVGAVRLGYHAFYVNMQANMAFMPLLPPDKLLKSTTVVLLCLGTFIGTVGSAISLKKFLRV